MKEKNCNVGLAVKLSKLGKIGYPSLQHNIKGIVSKELDCDFFDVEVVWEDGSSNLISYSELKKWEKNTAPKLANNSSIVKEPTPGEPSTVLAQICDILEDVKAKSPYLRFTQIILNATGNTDIYYLGDLELLDILNTFYNIKSD
jgi:hypothetical protein